MMDVWYIIAYFVIGIIISIYNSFIFIKYKERISKPISILLILYTIISPIVWPLGGILLIFLIKFSNYQRIVVAEASASLLHKALRHLVKACEIHEAVCTYKEESLNGLVSFSNEVLMTDISKVAIQRVSNLEVNAMDLKSNNDELARALYDIYSSLNLCTKLYEHQFNFEKILDNARKVLNEHCFCSTNDIICHKHGQHNDDYLDHLD